MKQSRRQRKAKQNRINRAKRTKAQRRTNRQLTPMGGFRLLARDVFRGFLKAFRKSRKHVPHCGAKQMARYTPDDPVAQARLWASWKTGRSVTVVNGIPFCTPAPGDEARV